MSEMLLRGDRRVLLTHMTMIGLAAILEDAGAQNVRVGWTDEMQCRPRVIADDVDFDQAAAIIRDHARAHGAAPSWVAERIQLEDSPKPKLVGLMSPRVKTLPRIDSPEGQSKWTMLSQHRQRCLDVLTESSARLDLMLIGSLGAPSYWHRSQKTKEPLQDHGASRWEMKTRNAGEEFVGNRLHLLADDVARRDGSSVRDGLTGLITRDIAGKVDPESRTATGMAAPGPTDAAAAWCALWGISQLPVVLFVTGPESRSTPSRSAGHLPHRRPHRGWLYLPMPISPMAMPRLRTILASAPLRDFVQFSVESSMRNSEIDRGDANLELNHQGHRKWLADRGVAAVAHFEVIASSNPSAPELRALDGLIDPVGLADGW